MKAATRKLMIGGGRRFQPVCGALVRRGPAVARSVLGWRQLLMWALVAAALAVSLGVLLGQALPGARPLVARAPARSHAFTKESLLSLPLGAQGPVSAALGADRAGYGLSALAGGYAATNPAQHLHASFTASGVSVASGRTSVGLSLSAVGYGSSLRAVSSVAPSAHANRILYAYHGLREWYENGPLGLEQGFTLSHPLSGASHGPLTLAIGISGNAAATLEHGAQAVLFTRKGRAALRYTGLSVSDAHGHALHSWLSLNGKSILIHVDTIGAAYPLRIDPLVQQGEKLTASGEIGEGSFGSAVALSEDGDTALIGGFADNGYVGAAWVFTRSGATWTQQAKLTAKAGEEIGEGYFGEAVALSADGNTALIGAQNENGGKGAAWVFTRSGTTWMQQGPRLTGGKESGFGGFGGMVALAGDGDTALIGGAGDHGGIGAAWVFTRSGESWTQQGPKLTAGGEVGEAGFGGGEGSGGALSYDGDTALVSGAGDNGEIGAAWVFTRSGTKWSQQAKLTAKAGEEVGDAEFGEGAALSADGDTALIGAPGDEGGAGAAWVFTRESETWTQKGSKLTGAGAAGKAGFGGIVALDDDASTALIGGVNDNEDVGAAWVFTRTGETWSQEGSKLTGGGEVGKALFGYGLALSGEGDQALIGASNDDAGLGAVWAFATGPTVVTGAASEVTPSSATLSASVNPNEVTVSECSFEYGATSEYGQSQHCVSPPGSGGTAVPVSASLSALSPDSTYHYRIVATNAQGTSYGADETFTTLASYQTAETTEETKPAEASEDDVSVTASKGTGAVTVGSYDEEDIGGPALPRGTGKYFDVYHSAGASFKQIEIRDCELGGGKSLWWDNPAATWEPISEPTAKYVEGSPACITATLSESTHPSVAQLVGTRYGTRYGDPPGELEYGKCVAQKDGFYEEAHCSTPDLKKGAPKGKYEWHANPVGCYAKKSGYYTEGCGELDVKKGKPKGKAELAGAIAYTAKGGPSKFEIEGVGTLECATSTSVGSYLGEKTGRDTIVFEECMLANAECASGTAAKAIQTETIETFLEEEGEKVETEAFQEPLATFSCGSTHYTLSGGIRGETTGLVNMTGTSSETVFGPNVAEQALETIVNGVEHKTTMTSSLTTTYTQEMEINTTR